jgi:D-alanyl-D-alanine carboxypeptidase/D-alanyl-D-alanine-endopeptidase (penicillin-binding protein 4)
LIRSSTRHFPGTGAARGASGFAALAAAIWILTATVLPVRSAALTDTDSSWARLERRLGPADAVAVAAPDGTPVFSVRENLPLIPASTLKILTALSGFEILGADHRFVTDFFLSPNGDLVIKGYGDPMLVSEVVAQIARHLADVLGPEGAVGDVVLDDAFFAEPLSIPGVNDSLEPYDAPNGALCVNFNTVFFARGPDGTFQSAEPQTPLLAPALRRIRASGLDRGRIVFSRSRQESLMYAGQLFAHFLAEAGIRITGEIRPGRVDPAQDRLLYRHRSPFTLAAVIGRLMEFSNNFIANQILISIGAERFGAPGNLENGTRAVEQYARQRLGLKTLHLVEGSGISRENRITAAGMMTILSQFRPYRHLLVRDGDVRYKTGTLSGIQTRAGYIETADGPCRFVVLINTPGRRADPVVRAIAKAISVP